MKNTLLLALSLSLIGLTNAIAAEGNVASGKEKTASCAGCHGEDGNSPADTFPKLAGQHASYIVKQLVAFKSGERKDAMMAALASSLSEQDMQDAAAFYASQKVTPNAKTEADAADKEDAAALLIEGRNLYRNGNLATQVSACIACHGPFGDGNKPAAFPLLKSQHTAYLIKTLTDFKTDLRSNNPENMMHMIAKKMSEREIKAVSVFLSNLQH